MIEMADVNFVEFKEAEEAHVRFFPNGTVMNSPSCFAAMAMSIRKISLEVVTALASVDLLR